MRSPHKTVEAFAPAKINLTLHVTGQRADGYHLLDSLVVFADVGDRLKVTPAENLSLTVSGPMAAGVPTDASNLVWRAAEWFGTPFVAVELEKHLPAAAGIGGGSSDAAAMLLALAKCFGRSLPEPKDTAILGADVPACLQARTCRVSGIGDRVEPVSGIPDLPIVLVNPGVAVSTPAVFCALERKGNPPMPDMPRHGSVREFCGWLRDQRNDLENAAQALEPRIAEVLKALSELGALVVRMSGSGATCFAIFADRGDAYSAEYQLLERYPDWWICAVATCDPDG